MDPSSSDSAPDGWRLLRRPHGRLDFVAADGTVHPDVDVLRAFPVSAPLGPVAVVAADGAELAWIDTLATLPEAFRARLLGELSAREFLPVIERIEAIAVGEPSAWSVVTDRGPHHFQVAHGDDVVRDADGGAMITDTFGLRYRIRDLARLDGRSRRLLDRAL